MMASSMGDKILATSINGFAVDFLQYESQNRDNVFFSSASISTAFAMLATGAKAQTQHGLHQALHTQYLPDLDDMYNSVLNSLQSAANGNDSFDLNLANKLYTQTGSVVLDSYQNTLKSKYHADIEVVNFGEDQGKAAVTKINGWVSEQTKGLIDSIVSPPMDPSTKLVLINAIYFQGTWVNPFDKIMTHKAKFHGIDETEVDFMNKEDYIRVLEPEGKNFALLELEYKGNASMIILLPNQDANLDDIVTMTTNDDYEAHIDLLMKERLTKCNLYMPKFKLETEFDLKPVLSSLGASQVFSPGAADLSGINGQQDLYVSKAIHKAVVDVDETGTKAAGVTAIFGVAMSLPIVPPPTYRMDRPFLFFIRDHGTGINLFTGLVGQL
ncbi:Serpin B8 [Halotydeus destructor]|nr:Serpin B8 [Halotydeus destructor]